MSSCSSSSKVVVGGGGARKGNNGMNDIPSKSRQVVQSLKEVVNSPEAEIYAMLKECNMDPNEAVHRLLSQDPFHEVKSKKEKKKETRDISDSRPRGANNTYNRGGGRGGSDRYAGRSASTRLSSSTDSGNFQGKSTHKKESGSQGYTSSWSSASRVPNHQQTQHSDSVVTENKLPLPSSTGDGMSLSQPASGHQTAWFGAPGQMSMADIVKMGRPQNKTTNSKQYANSRSEISHEHEANANHQVPVKEEWPTIQKPLAPGTSSVSVAPVESEVCDGQADFQSARVDQHLSDRLENVHLAENGLSENLGVDQVQPDSVTGKIVQEDDSGVSSEFNENQYAYQTQSHPAEHHKDEDDDFSSGSADFQRLTVDSHDQGASHEENRRAVVIPNHLLIHTEECSQLSFGSFGAFGSRPLSNNNAEETPDVAQQIEHSDARNTEFYGDEHLGSTVNGNIGHAPAAGSYDDSLETRQEVLKQENPETVQEHQYTYAQSDEPEYANQQLNSAYDASQTHAQNQTQNPETVQEHQYTFSQSEPGYAKQQQLNNTAYDASQTHAQNLASLSNVMGYTQSVPNSLLAQNARELDFQYSPFAQSMQARNSNNASSALGGQSISMPEAHRGSENPVTQQNLPGANIATGPALPQQLPMHHYTQPTMPLAHFANMISYPMMPQNYPYMPSAFQQAFAGNSSYHQQQLAALLPQYKTNLSPSNLPQSATAPASAYGFGNSPLNQQSAPTGYEDVLSSQYKENSHLLALQQQQQQHQQQQQNDNSAMWHHGHGSRTMSGVPANTYYNLQAQQLQQLQQSQQAAAGGYRQAQQQQQYGSHGYPNFYQSQTEMPHERQQQNPREGAGGGQAGQPSKQTQQQLWQNSY